jgi:fibrillarin-like rRNA methylase
MANGDDVNKSNKPINGKVPKQLESDFKHWADVTGDDSSYNIEISERIDRKEREYKTAENIYNKVPTVQNQQRLQKLAQVVADLRQRDIDLDNIRLENQNRILSARIQTYLHPRNVKQRTASAAGDTKYFHQINRNTDDLYMPTSAIESNIDKLQATVSGYGPVLSSRVNTL